MQSILLCHSVLATLPPWHAPSQTTAGCVGKQPTALPQCVCEGRRGTARHGWRLEDGLLLEQPPWLSVQNARKQPHLQHGQSKRPKVRRKIGKHKHLRAFWNNSRHWRQVSVMRTDQTKACRCHLLTLSDTMAAAGATKSNATSRGKWAEHKHLLETCEGWRIARICRHWEAADSS